jgi:hypothetical protein
MVARLAGQPDYIPKLTARAAKKNPFQQVRFENPRATNAYANYEGGQSADGLSGQANPFDIYNQFASNNALQADSTGRATLGGTGGSVGQSEFIPTGTQGVQAQQPQSQSYDQFLRDNGQSYDAFLRSLSQEPQGIIPTNRPFGGF